MHLTWLDSNTWLLELGGKRLLVDPWLVGPLVFGNFPWLFKGEHRTPCPIPQDIDLIVLSQGLEDHAHPPTLRQLARTIPVLGSAGAAKVAQELGYTQVTALAHGQTFRLADSVEIRATAGAPIGPTVVENGYWFKDLTSGVTLYYEPHGYPAPSLKGLAPVDVVITPLMDLSLPLVGPIIQGMQSALEVALWLQPQVILPTAAAGEVVYEGWLVSLLKAAGGPEEFRALLAQRQLLTQVLEPKPGERFELSLQPRTPEAVS